MQYDTMLIMATMAIMVQYKMFQIHMLYTLNLHNTICQMYFQFFLT